MRAGRSSAGRALYARMATCAAAALALCLLVVAPSASEADASSSAGGPSSTEDSTAWSFESDCEGCHVTQEASFETADGEVASSAEADDASGMPGASGEADATSGGVLAPLHESLACTSCHADEAALAKAHKKVDVTAPEEASVSRLKKTGIDQELCMGCHGTLDELAAATDAYDGLTDDQGTTVNPHALPEVAEHGKVTCASCHAMHDDADVTETAQALCSSCHHAGVYECYTCH